MELKKEYIYYKTNKEKLVKEHRGSFVLIKGAKTIGFFETEKEAYKAGLEHFGNQPFLIQKVTSKEEITRTPALTLGIL